MKVRIETVNDLCRLVKPDTERSVVLHFEYVDDESTSHREACQRAWRITSAAIMRLNEKDLSIRMKWEANARGLGLSVGDVVSVDGVRYQCCPDGWSHVQR